MDPRARNLANFGQADMVKDAYVIPEVVAGVVKKSVRDAVQFAGDAAKPERKVPPIVGLTGISHFDAFKPAAWIALTSRSHLNTTVDAAFYNVAGLTAEERNRLTDMSSPEGAILIMQPSNGSTPMSNPFKTVDDFKKDRTEGLDTVVVAGVGSSFLGTAALARSVADILRRPVAGVVSGYGLADLSGEALGGWFGLGIANAMARIAGGILGRIKGLEEVSSGWVKSSTGPVVATSMDTAKQGYHMTHMGQIGGVRDSDVLSEILRKVPKIVNVIGHSKGSFVLENALKGVPARTDLRVLTLGAPAYFSSNVQHYQVVGGLDLLGMLNTRAARSDYQVQPFATHVVKPGPFGLDLAAAMEKAGIQ